MFFGFVLLCIRGEFLSTSSPRWAYIWRGDLTVGFSALRVWGAYIWKGLIFGILLYQFTKRLLKGKLKGFSEFPKNMCLIEYRTATKYQDF